VSRYWNDKTGEPAAWPIIRDILLALMVLVAAIMWGCPQYNVWEQGLRGQAELRRAEQNRQIKVQEATAHEESAKHYARAEIERAKGVSEANKIIGEGLRGNEDYLRYLWIMSLEHVAASPNGSTVVYVPTEANLPIMEANRLKPKP
jgi:regulator of protease activity HflC (stomatin/prohibitin superfamily)